MRLPTVLFTLAAIGMIAACNQSAEPATPPHAEEPAPQAPALAFTPLANSMMSPSRTKSRKASAPPARRTCP